MKKTPKSVYIYLALIGAILLLSLFPEYLTGKSPFDISFRGALPPSADHLLGTDFLGRDILTRTLIGGRISIAIGVLSRAGSVLLGLALGLVAGLSAGVLRGSLNAVIEVFLSIPALLLALALVMVLGEGYLTVIIAVMAGTWAPVARFISSRVSELKNEDFVTAARALGAGRFRISFHHIIPSLVPVLLPLLTTGIATSIMLESTLSFLGLGGGSSITDTPSWGAMIQEGSRFMFDAPWIIIPPSLLLSVLILSFNQAGDRMAD